MLIAENGNTGEEMRRISGIKYNICGIIFTISLTVIAAIAVRAGDIYQPAAGYESEIEDDSTVNNVNDAVNDIIERMTLHEKVAQLFIITPETLTGVTGVTMAGETTRDSFSEYPVGGIIYMEQNIQTWDQTRNMMNSMQKISMDRMGIPVFLAVDEEGGTVRRISGRLEGVPYVPEMSYIGNSNNPRQAYDIGRVIGDYLSRLGINVDFAPVTDVQTNPSNSVIGSRSFSNDPQVVAEMVSKEVKGLHEYGVCATLKHFPGHGDTAEDSHKGIACSYKSLEELECCELIPFKSGIEEGADFVMVGHISLPNVIGDNLPATLSYTMLTDILRGDLGFHGIIVTDALNMGAIVNMYSSGEAAIKAFLAGADMLLMPADFYGAFNAIVEAAESGRISNERLNESLRRIISLKLKVHQSSDVKSDIGTEEINQEQGLQTDPYSYENSETGFEGVIVEG